MEGSIISALGHSRHPLRHILRTWMVSRHIFSLIFYCEVNGAERDMVISQRSQIHSQEFDYFYSATLPPGDTRSPLLLFLVQTLRAVSDQCHPGQQQLPLSHPSEGLQGNQPCVGSRVPCTVCLASVGSELPMPKFPKETEFYKSFISMIL